MTRTHLKNPHRRECTAKGGIARRKAQGVAEATFKLSNEARVPFAVHPKGGALLPRLVVASPRRSFGYAFVEAPRYGTKSLPLPPMGIFEMGSKCSEYQAKSIPTFSY